MLARTRLLVVVLALAVGVSAWAASTIQRDAANAGRAHLLAGELLLTGMLDQETGLRGFLLTGRESFLAPYDNGMHEYRDALAQLRGFADRTVSNRLDAADRIAHAWRAQATRAIATRRAGTRGDGGQSIRRKRTMDAFRNAQAAVARAIEADRRGDARSSELWTIGASLLLALLVGVAGDRLLDRREREMRRRREAETRYRETQAAFAETMQIAESEAEAHQLLKRHVEREVASASVVVLNRNNSADRLEPTTRVDDPGVAEQVHDAQPRSCLAIRLGRANVRDAGQEPLMACEICGAAEGSTTCKPLLVGSEVIGSVLVTHDKPLDEHDRARLRDSVSQAAPVLANLRNLAIAENRAATDGLTGLPNRRSIEETLKRMVAQASRMAQPLVAIMLDLDHFKTINDRFGHDRGDEALAAVGALLLASLRESDFAGRYGGEEFVVLAPATDLHGGAQLAENLRAAVSRLESPGLAGVLSASLGVAAFPAAAVDGAGLLRAADRALYAAKERGRDRVELAAARGLDDVPA